MLKKDSKERWIHLFDGKSLKGWSATGNKEAWIADNGTLLCITKRIPAPSTYLYTMDEYENFILSLDFKIERGANSGVFIRLSDLNDPINTGLEVQICDSYGRERIGKHDCGAIYDLVAPIKNACKPPEVWNNMIITCLDNIVIVDLNGERIVEMDINKWDKPGLNPDGSRNKFKYAWKDMPRKGHIALQNHPCKKYTQAKVWFRNIKLKLA